MFEPFDIPVIHHSKELSFPAQLIKFGFTYRIQVEVNGQEVLFEPDEERSYRAIVEPENLANSKIDIELIKAITGAIEAILK